MSRRCEYAEPAAAADDRECKKKLAELATLDNAIYHADLFDIPGRVREGVDFSSQAQLQEREGVSEAKATRLVEGDHRMIRLVRRALRDLQMFRHTGTLPHGKPYSEQPAYMVQLYRAVWESIA